MKKQASVLVIRFETPEYYAALGVWVVRSASRKAMSNSPKAFDGKESLLKAVKDEIYTRFKYNIDDGVLNNGGVNDDGKWHSFDQNFIGLDVGKVNITRQIYKSYKNAYGEYFDNHKKSKRRESFTINSKNFEQF